jgi:hypothetical protein
LELVAGTEKRLDDPWEERLDMALSGRLPSQLLLAVGIRCWNAGVRISPTPGLPTLVNLLRLS